MEYRDGDPRTPVSAENLNRTEKKLKVLSASVDDMTTTMTEIDQRLSQSETKINTAIQRITEANPGVDQETLKRLIKDELAALPPGEKPEATDVDRLIDEKLQAAVAKLPAAQPVGEAEISKAVTQYMAEHPVPAAQEAELSPFRWFNPGKRYWCPVTYWWADQRQPGSKWNYIFSNLDIIGFVIINPRSGFGDKVEPDFTDLTTELKKKNVPGIGYVRTIKGTRSTDEVLAEIRKYQEAYHLEGVFLDEMINGWSEAEAALIAQYKKLYQDIKAEFGKGFLVVGNPGTNTKPEMLECADILMSFEKKASQYLNDTDAPVTPDHYRAESPLRFVHAIHNLESTDQLRQVLEKAEKSNVAFFYATDDTFSGVEGSENENNNPWDSVPGEQYRGPQWRWCRRQQDTTPAAPVPQVTLVSDAGAAYVTDNRFGEITGGDITANLQAAINDPQVKVIKIPSGEFQIKHVNVDKLAGKRLEGAGRDVTKLAFDKTATNVPFLATSGGKLTRATFHGFTLDMGWQKGDTIRHGIQLSNAPFITFDGLRILNSGGAGILLQSLGKKADADSTGGVFDDIQMDGIGLSDRTTDHGIRLVGNAGNASIRNLDFRNIKGGMGVGGVDDVDLKKGPSNITIESSFIRMAEGTTGFEPIGFTKGCSDIIVRGNHLWSFDNGTSLSGPRCKFDNNIVYQAWNFGVSLGADDADFEATVGSTVTNNTFMDVALQNETRDAAKPVEYAVVRLAKPRRCVISGNTYIGRPKLPAYFVKIVGNNFGFNDITGNAVSKSDFSRVPVNNTVATDKVQEFLDDQTPAAAVPAAAVAPGHPQQ